MLPDDFDNWQEVLDTLEHSGFTDYRQFPEVFMAWRVAKQTDDFGLLSELLKRDPWIINSGKKRLRSCPFFLPKREDLHKIRGEFNFGMINNGMERVGLKPLDFTRGLFICGETGSGKSFPTLRICKQVLSIPKNERGFNLLIVQGLKRDADFLIKRHPNLRIIEWEDLRRAPFQVEKWDVLTRKVNSYCGIFSAINWLMIHSQPLFKRALIRCNEQNGVLEGSENFPIFSEIFEQIDPAAKELKLDGYEHRNVRDHLKFALHAFIETKGNLNIKHGYTIQDFWSKEDIILNVMDENNDYVVSTIIIDLFRDLQRFNHRDQRSSSRLLSLIIADECRRIFPVSTGGSQTDHNPQTETIRFLTTKRASGIGLVCVTQEPQSAPSYLTDNCAFALAMPIGGEARDHVKQLLNLNEQQTAYLDELGERGTGIFRDRRLGHRYILDIPGDLEVEKISLEETAQIMRPFIIWLQTQLESHEDYETEAVDLEQMEQEANNQKIGIPILNKLREKPFLQSTQLVDEIHKQYKFKKKNVATAIEWLKDKSFVLAIEARGSKTKNATYFPLTKKAQGSLKMNAQERIAASHFKHTFYCNVVKGWVESQGYKAVREYSNISEDRTTKDRIDVLGFQDHQIVAYEITLTIDVSGLVKNIRKCLDVFNVDMVNIVCERQDPDIEKALEIVSEHIPGQDYERIGFLSMTHFL